MSANLGIGCPYPSFKSDCTHAVECDPTSMIQEGFFLPPGMIWWPFQHRLGLAGGQEVARWLQPTPGCTEEVLKCLVELRLEDFSFGEKK